MSGYYCNLIRSLFNVTLHGIIYEKGSSPNKVLFRELIFCSCDDM